MGCLNARNFLCWMENGHVITAMASTALWSWIDLRYVGELLQGDKDFLI